MLVPTTATVDNIRKLLSENEHFNPQKLPVDELIVDINYPLTQDTVDTYAYALNMSSTLEQLKFNINKLLDAQRLPEEEEEEQD